MGCMEITLGISCQPGQPPADQVAGWVLLSVSGYAFELRSSESNGAAPHLMAQTATELRIGE